MGAHSYIVVGMQYGDEGKGTITEFLTRKHNSTLTVRYNGGAQAAHNVVLQDGRHHTFSQFGSGTFEGARTYLSRYMLVNPLAVLKEAHGLEDAQIASPLSRLVVSADAVVTTPFHIALNRLSEIARGAAHNGSCGMGIGETRADELYRPYLCLRIRDLKDTDTCVRQLKAIQKSKWRNVHQAPMRYSEFIGLDSPTILKEPHWDHEDSVLSSQRVIDYCLSQYHEFLKDVEVVEDSWLQSELKKDQAIIFEGAQGVLLDEDWGFQPHTTWTKTTAQNALSLVLAKEKHAFTRVGVLRAYMTRHGAGPFVTEHAAADRLSGSDHNRQNRYQGAFRSGWFDMVATKYAVQCMNGVEELAITHMDKMMAYCGDGIPVCMHYKEGTEAGAGAWHEIPKTEQPVFDTQRNLALRLLNARPMLTSMHLSEFIPVLEAACGQARVSTLSWGPTAEDKALR